MKPIARDLLRQMRRRMKITQRRFAITFGLAPGTLRHWERGNRKPTGPALALLFAIDANPRVVREAVRKARLKYPGCLPAVPRPRSYRAPPGFGARERISRSRDAPPASGPPKLRLDSGWIPRDDWGDFPEPPGK